MQQNNSKILVIEDDRDVRNLVSTVLTKHGYNCVTAGSTSEGLTRFTADVGLVITDLNMPGDGVALIQSVRAVRDVPIVILTGYHRQYADRLDPLGYITWLTKPIEFESLLAIVKLELARPPAGARMPIAGAA